MSIFKGIRAIDGQREPNGYQQMTSISSATGVTAPSGTSFAIITIETAAVRWRDDGTDPTGSVGMPESAGTVYTYTGDFSALKFIQQSAGAIVNLSYYK